MEGLKNDNPLVRILVIDDDEETRSLLKDFLEEDGFVTDSVCNGSDALRKLAKQPFDLIITDIRMPALTGLDILPVIKRLQPETSIIVITAFGSEEVYRRSFERGATVYLEKPLHISKLKELIHKMSSSKEKRIGGKAIWLQNFITR
jgi:DNA-binding NtrC family response regulator